MTKRSLDLKATDVAPVNLLVPISLRCVPSELNRCIPLLSATATFPDVSSIAILLGQSSCPRPFPSEPKEKRIFIMIWSHMNTPWTTSQ